MLLISRRTLPAKSTRACGKTSTLCKKIRHFNLKMGSGHVCFIVNERAPKINHVNFMDTVALFTSHVNSDAHNDFVALLHMGAKTLPQCLVKLRDAIARYRTAANGSIDPIESNYCSAGFATRGSSLLLKWVHFAGQEH